MKKVAAIFLSLLLSVGIMNGGLASVAANAADTSASSTTSTETTVDKQDLKAAIEKAETIYDKGNADSTYTSESWQELEAILETAKADDENTSVEQEIVSADTEKLNSAIDGLEKTTTTVDKQDLKAAIEKAETIYDKGNTDSTYTSESWQELTNALETAKADDENTSVEQEIVKGDTEKLNSAIDGLEKTTTTVDKQDLKAAIEKAKTIYDKGNTDNTYTSKSWQKLKAALETATADNENTSVEQEIVSADTEKLNSAIDGLEKTTTTVEVTKIILSDGELIVGFTSTKHASIIPHNATDKTLTWHSSDPSVVSIDPATGKMTAVKEGTATITATAKNNVSASCVETVISKEKANQEAKDAFKNLPSSSTSTFTDEQKEAIQEAVDAVSFAPDPVKAVGMDAITNLETLLEKITSSTVTQNISAPNTAAISNENDKLKETPTVSNLLLAAGIMGDEDEEDKTKVTLGITQEAPTGDGALLAFKLTLNNSNEGEITDLFVPVVITVKLPNSFVYRSGYTYTIRHDKEDGTSETLNLAINYDAANKCYCGKFTTDSFSTFTVIAAKNSSGSSSGSSSSSSSSHHHSSNSGSTTSVSSTPSTPSVTYVSDTTNNFTVNDSYQFKITSKNGKAPVITVGTSGVFNVQLVKTSGNDYYFKLTAIGIPDAQAGIYVNGQKLLVATVGSSAFGGVKCDTTLPFKVKAGTTYTFKITAKNKPVFACGNGSVFAVSFAGQKGSDYFFKAKAVGKAGNSTGFYINGYKVPCVVAAVS